MNNLKTLALAICFSLISSITYAEVRLGISAHAISFQSSGSETLRTSGNVTKRNVDESLVVPSIFIEKMMGSGNLGLGLDYIPVAELGSGTGADDDAETSGANKASAELASHSTLYVIAQNDNGLYFRAGVSFADVDTTENLATGDTYGNTSTEGVMVAAGYSRSMDNGFFIRGEVSSTDYDDVEITSTGGSKVKADIDASAVTLSIGKAF